MLLFLTAVAAVLLTLTLLAAIEAYYYLCRDWFNR